MFRVRSRIVFAVWLLASVGVGFADTLRFPADRPVDIQHIRLDLNIDLPGKTASGTATTRLVALRDVPSIRFDAVDFDVASVTLVRRGGPAKDVDFINDGASIEVLLGDDPLVRGETAMVRLAYSVTDPKMGLHFFGPTDAEPDVPLQAWSQGESIENRYWFPSFDHPNEMQTTEMVVTAAAGNEVVSNGRLVSKKENPDGTVTFHWLQDKPHVAYLVTLVVGRFYVEEESWRGRPVVYYVPEKHKDDVQRSFGHTVRMLEHFSNTIGVEYPWDKYAQICAEQFGGGMENTSATTLGDGTLHDERAHLDTSSDGLVAHELAHQWFGDLVTCKDWSHLWLNEGFASYMEPVWYDYDRGRDDYDYAIFQDMRSAIRGGKDRPVVDLKYQDPDDMFDSRAYPKGSSILHMLRHRVGDELFWRSIKRYLTEHAHTPVETSDLRKAFEAITGRSLQRFFYDWTQRPGAPSLDVAFKWLEGDKLARVVVKQTQDADPFHFPFEVEFRFDDAEPIMFKRDITEKQARFFIPLPSNPTMVRVDPRSAVLKEIKENKGRDLWVNQLTHDPSVVGRILAAQHFGDAGGDRDVDVLADALMTEPFWGVGAEIARALGKAGGDKARDALLKGLTHEHPKVRAPCASQLASFHGDERVIGTLYALIDAGDPSYRVEAAAIRSYGRVTGTDAVKFLTSLLSRPSHREQIRSAALSAIGNQEEPDGLDVLLEWTRRGHPRRCRQAAIRAIGTLADTVQLEDKDLTRIVDALVETIAGEHRWTQQAAISTLGRLGDAAKPALAALRAIQTNDPEPRTRRAAKRAVEKITATTPAKVQVKELREELEALQKAKEKLEQRLERLESKGAEKVAQATPASVS
ncbi:MAG: M1 family aminopeptidase [Phycisphaerae bacterium]